MAQIDELKDIQSQILAAYEKLHIESLASKSSQLQELMQQPDFWNDNERAQTVSKQHSTIQRRVDFWQELLDQANELVELCELGDDSLANEIASQYSGVVARFNTAKRELQFNGPHDDREVILSIFAGAGGVDAQDWAQMLLRMYSRWAESDNVSVDIIDQSAGEEAGIKSVTLSLSGGSFLYGRLQSENGVHRLVRLSPFNADNLRQTSFARVEVMPKIDSPEAVDIDEKDLKIDVFRSGGKGGQSVNTTDSAVRITHVPTHIVVSIQNERSQLQNKETAMTILRSKLAQLQLEQHQDRISELKGPNEQAAWGNQIRNYVLHPYTMVKDTRTKCETTDAQAVLDGAIDQFIEAFLEHNLT